MSSRFCERTLIGHSKAVLSLVVILDGRLCSGSRDSTIRLWSIEDGICEQMLTGHTEGVDLVLPLKDGRICSTSADTTIKIWT